MLAKRINAWRHGSGFGNKTPAEQSDIKRVGARVRRDGSVYLPAVPFRAWPLIKLGPLAFRGLMPFVWQHDHYVRAKLLSITNEHFWFKYTRCRVFGRHHYMLSTFSLGRQGAKKVPSESYRCSCCNKPAGVIASDGETIRISAPMAKLMLKNGLDETFVQRNTCSAPLH